MRRSRLAHVTAAATALVLLVGCGVAGSQGAPTWVPKPEGPPPAEAPDPGAPGLPRDPGGSGNGGGPAAPGQPDDPSVVATGLRLPWGLALLPDGTALVGERTTGRLLQVRPYRSPARQVMRLTGLDTTGDGGLLDLALSPNYPRDHLVFAYITTKTDNRIVRFEIGGRPTPVLTRIPRGRTDNGGRLAFDRDGLLYVGTGDAGRPALAHDPRSLAGKVLRVTAFGRPAPDNPDPRSPVFSIGHRAIAGLCLDGQPRVYTTESRAPAEEVNRVQPGQDYGWPAAARVSSPPNATPAELTLPAGTGVAGCAVVERGLFVASLHGSRLWTIPLDAAGHPSQPSSILSTVYGRLRTVVAAPDGALWLTTSNRDGAGRPVAQDDRVIRILPPADTTNSPA